MTDLFLQMFSLSSFPKPERNMAHLAELHLWWLEFVSSPPQTVVALNHFPHTQMSAMHMEASSLSKPYVPPLPGQAGWKTNMISSPFRPLAYFDRRSCFLSHEGQADTECKPIGINFLGTAVPPARKDQCRCVRLTRIWRGRDAVAAGLLSTRTQHRLRLDFRFEPRIC